jgi:hypothetical protein
MSDSGDNGAVGATGEEKSGLMGRAERDLHRLSDSYGLVFVMIVATLLATAFVGDSSWGRAVAALLMAATLLLTFRASQVERRRRRIFGGIVLGLLLVGVLAGVTGDGAANNIVGTVIAAVFVVAASSAIVHRLRNQTEVTMKTVMGALCVYLFIGLFFAVVYTGVDLVDEGPFFAQTEDATGVDFIYYSFITQATVGYGDLSPITDLGRMLAITEALLGQVYLVTIVAALVSNIGRVRHAQDISRPAAEASQGGDETRSDEGVAPSGGPRACAELPDDSA